MVGQESGQRGPLPRVGDDRSQWRRGPIRECVDGHKPSHRWGLRVPFFHVGDGFGPHRRRDIATIPAVDAARMAAAAAPATVHSPGPTVTDVSHCEKGDVAGSADATAAQGSPIARTAKN